MPRKTDLWERVVARRSIDLLNPISYVLARDVKDITGQEPRLMASMNQESDLPDLFRTHGVFVLPMSRMTYALVKGKGYHTVEQISSPPIEHVSTIPPSISEIGRGTVTETQFIDYAYNSGLLERFLKVTHLWLGPRGKMATPRFQFRVGNVIVEVDRAQMEIDASYFSDDCVAPVEAKVGIPTSFSIRQIYYPYRTLRNRYPENRIRSLFFAFDQADNTYNLWEYTFLDESDYESIAPVGRERFRIRVEPLSPQVFLTEGVDLTNFIPQADDFDKVLEVPLKVAKGARNSALLAEEFGFTVRQSSYYRQAAEMLQLVSTCDKQYELTDTGMRFVQLPTTERNRAACELLFRHPVMHDLLVRLISKPSSPLSRIEVNRLIKDRSMLRGTTPARRTQTIFKWFLWIQRTIGIVTVTRNEILLSSSIFSPQ